MTLTIPTGAVSDTAKQDNLVTGTNIKTVNGMSILGTGDIIVSTATAPLLFVAAATAYTITATDAGKIINCTGSFTVSLTASATLGPGFNCTIWNSSATVTDVITIDPNSTETIDGVSTILLRRGEGVQIICTGTSWTTSAKKAIRSYTENILSTSTRSVASGNNSIAVGLANTSSGEGSISLGNTNTSSGTNSIAVGSNCTASGTNSTTIGSNCTTSDTYTVAQGYFASSTRYGKFAHASGMFAATGDAQYGRTILRASTAAASATVLTSDLNAASTNNQVILPNDSTYFFTVTLVARRTDTDNESAAWKFDGCIDRNTSAASTAFVGVPVKTVLAEDSVAWDANVAVDVINGGLSVTGTGEVGKVIKWVATVHTTEVTG